MPEIMHLHTQYRTLVAQIQADADFNPIKVIRHAIEAANTEIIDQAQRDEGLRGWGRPW